MSDKNQARRTTAEVVFNGTDITASIRPYLLSLTYTDNEEDEADDLQIKLQDRDGLWLEEWLNDAIQAAAYPSENISVENFSIGNTVMFIGTRHYISSTSNIGYTAKQGPAKITLTNPGSLHPWHLIHTDSTSNVYGWVDSADIKSIGSIDSQASKTGFKVCASIIRKNWNSDGKNITLDCGQFELDSVRVSGPPSIVTIKATSLPFSSQIRQTEKTKVWEAYNLSGIVQEMANANGMSFLYESSTDPYYERVEQYKMSDIKFLSELCHNSGISLKATNNILVLFDQADYEAKKPTFIVKRGSGTYIKYDLSVGTADTKYSSCRVRYADPATGQVIEGIAYAENYKENTKTNQQLEVTAKVVSIAEAQTLAAKQLRLHNKYSCTATFTFPGDPYKVAGVTAILEGWGTWDGKYIIKQSKHSLGSSGYTTQTVLRRILEGY